jgi:hypothetical protein
LVAKWFVSGFYFWIRLLQQPGFLNILFRQGQFAEGNLVETENFPLKSHPGFCGKCRLSYLPSGAESKDNESGKFRLRQLFPHPEFQPI